MLIEEDSFLDRIVSGATRLTDAATAFNTVRTTYQGSRDQLATARAESAAAVHISQINADKAVALAKQDAARASFDFSGARDRLVSAVSSNQTPILIGGAALLAVLLIMRAR